MNQPQSGAIPWRLLPFSCLPATEQMALSEALLATVQAPVLRWRQIVPEALVLGHGQRPESVDWQACQAAGVHVYRRATGGTAVLSGPDLLGLDLALPAGHPLALADVTRSYAWLGEALAQGLRSLGVAADAIAPEAARAQAREISKTNPVRLACYGTLSPYEVVAGGRKLAGLAQARRRAGILFQAGVVLRWQPERLVSLLAAPPPQRTNTVAALHARAVGLDQLSGCLDLPALIACLNAAIATASGAVLESGDWTAAESAAATDLQVNYAPLPD